MCDLSFCSVFVDEVSEGVDAVESDLRGAGTGGLMVGGFLICGSAASESSSMSFCSNSFTGSTNGAGVCSVVGFFKATGLGGKVGGTMFGRAC